MRPVLVLGAEPRVSLCVARSLWRRGITVDVAPLSNTAPRLRSRAVREQIRVSDADGEHPDRFSDKLLSLVETGRYDMLVPASDSALAVVAEHYDRLASLLHVGCPPPEIVSRVLDKDQTLAVARGLSMAVPESYEVATID